MGVSAVGVSGIGLSPFWKDKNNRVSRVVIFVLPKRLSAGLGVIRHGLLTPSFNLYLRFIHMYDKNIRPVGGRSDPSSRARHAPPPPTTTTTTHPRPSPARAMHGPLPLRSAVPRGRGRGVAWGRRGGARSIPRRRRPGEGSVTMSDSSHLKKRAYIRNIFNYR